MEAGIALSHAEPDGFAVLILFVAVVLFGLFLAGGLWLLAKLSERMGWSKRRRRPAHIPRGARTRAPSKAVNFARQTDRLDQLELSPVPLRSIGAPQLHDALQAWAITRGAPDLRSLARVELTAFLTVTSPGAAGRAGAEVLRGQEVDYILADPSGMPIAGLMQTDPGDLHTATLLRETILREVFRKTDLPLIELGPNASEADIHAALDTAFDLLPDDTVPAAPRVSLAASLPMPQQPAPMPVPVPVPERTSVLGETPTEAPTSLGRNPRPASAVGWQEHTQTPLRPGRRTRSCR